MLPLPEKAFCELTSVQMSDFFFSIILWREKYSLNPGMNWVSIIPPFYWTWWHRIIAPLIDFIKTVGVIDKVPRGQLLEAITASGLVQNCRDFGSRTLVSGILIVAPTSSLSSRWIVFVIFLNFVLKRSVLCSDGLFKAESCSAALHPGLGCCCRISERDLQQRLGE